MRLDKFLSNLAYGSRNDIKKLAKLGKIYVNEKCINDSSFNVNPTSDKVVVDGSVVFFKENFCIMLNKPANYVSSNKDELYPSALNLLPDEIRRLDLKICGRLDYDTEGLLIITDNGDTVHQIISPKKLITKTYFVKLKERITNYEVLETGVTLTDPTGKSYLTKPAKITIIDDYTCTIEIHEGKFHQIKKMFEFIDNKVTYLKRIQVGKLKLDDLELGEFKFVELSEIL